MGDEGVSIALKLIVSAGRSSDFGDSALNLRHQGWFQEELE
jgi:hypothetical protein